MRVVAALIVALLTSGIVSPVTCAGWNASPESRRACCRLANHHHSGEQAAADDCCARHEQGRQGLSTHPDAASIGQPSGIAILVPAFDAAAVAHAAIARYSIALIHNLHAPPVRPAPPLRI